MPKPLLPIAGVPLIGRLLGLCSRSCQKRLSVSLTTRGPVWRTTCGSTILPCRSSLCSRTRPVRTKVLRCCVRICAALLPGHNGRLGFPPDFLPQFVAAASQQPGIDMMLTLTTFIDDENRCTSVWMRTSVLSSLATLPVAVPMSPRVSTTALRVSVRPALRSRRHGSAPYGSS